MERWKWWPACWHFTHGRIPATLNYSHPDPACPVNVVAGESWQAQHATAAVLSQSSAGQAVCVGLAGV